MKLDPIRFVQEAVAIPSVSGSEAALARHLLERCAPFADRSELDGAGNLVVQTGSGPLEIMVLGHLDTVSGDVPVRIDAGRLFGRGSVDAKGPLCCALLAAQQLSAAARTALRVVVVGAVEEEVASSRGARYLLERPHPPDLLIVAEPSGWDAYTLGYKGRLGLGFVADKPNRHSAEDVPTAAADAVTAWGLLSAWAEGANAGVAGLFDRLQVSLAALASSGDGLRQRAEVEVGLRLPPAWPPERTLAAVAALALPSAVTLVAGAAEAPYRGPRDTALTRAFRTSIRSEGGIPVAKLKTGTSDMNVVAPTWPVPMLAYGPGDSRLDHGPDEHLRLDEFELAISVLAGVFERLARGYSPESS